MAVHLWFADLDELGDRLPYLEILSVDERDRADRFRTTILRQRFIAGRGILRELLSRYLQQPPETFVFTYEERGKPGLASAPISFNLAHSQQWAIYGFVQHGPIGVDLEVLRPVPNLPELAQRFFSDRETQSLLFLPPDQQQQIFFRYWTCKEALLKAIGVGLAGLSQVEVDLSPSARFCRVPLHSPHDWQLVELRPIPQVAAALALSQGDWQLLFHLLDR